MFSGMQTLLDRIADQWRPLLVLLLLFPFNRDGKRHSKILYVGGLRGGDQGEVFWSPHGKIQKG
ncbi:MAG: hypothetical protein P8010_26070 [Desulfosarcinaceae bacterium]|jgi:hypothetical protein